MVLAFDLGLATCGWAGAELKKGATTIEGLGFIGTEKSSKKRDVLASHDDLRRARELWQTIDDKVRFYVPRVLIVERKSLPRNSSTAGKISMAWGVFAAIAQARELPVVQASPQEVRRFFELAKDASKDTITDAVMKTSPEAGRLLAVQQLNKADRQHPIDATAALYACLESEIVRAVRPR